jgi:uncharacterized membrane protein YgcG
MSGTPRQRRPGRLHLRRRRRDEDLIWTYQFPEHVEERCRQRHPDLTDREWRLVDQGLREWFLCCAWRDGEVLGMPSRLVDEAWHEFILDSIAYTDFCERAFGEYLHHTPEGSMATPMPEALDATSRAWDRSGAGGPTGAVLWGLDALLGLGHTLEGTANGGDPGVHHHGSAGEFEPVGDVAEAGGGESGGGGDLGGGGDSGGGDSGGGGCGGGGE